MLPEMHSIASQSLVEHHVNKFALPCAHGSTYRDVAGVSGISEQQQMRGQT